VNKEDVLNTKDGKSIAVSNQFSTENIKPFIKHAKTLGYVMTPAK
jgi:predicted ABC-type ATPase